MEPHEFVGLSGIKYAYCTHDYNDARTNERAVEIPVALNWAVTRSGNGLEVGNVLQHYYPAADWTVVDAFEKFPGVINFDIMDFNPSEKFDWIVTISTVEHIGWDEAMPGERDINKSLAAIEHMRGLLVPGGQLLVSFPTGIHPGLDKAVANGTLDPIDSVFMERTDAPQRRAPGIWEPRPFSSVPYLVEAWSAGAVWMGILSSTSKPA